MCSVKILGAVLFFAYKANLDGKKFRRQPLIGVEHAGGWFEELKFGGGGSPRVLFTAGYAFRFHKKDRRW
jgi:hypothetical protein